MQDFSYSIVVPATAGEVFEKIGRVWDWWAVNFSGWAESVHDNFTVHFARTTWSRMEILCVIPERRVVWRVADCHLPIFKDPHVWMGNEIVWDIAAEDDRTRVTMTHVGLTPGVECYADCSKGWSFYVGESLFKLLTEGKGLPGSGIFAEVIIAGRKYEGLLFSRTEPLPESAQGNIIIDVRENQGERVLSAWAVYVMEGAGMETVEWKGDHYMILEGCMAAADVQAGAGTSLLEDLRKIVG